MPAGRPKKTIDPGEVERLARMFCTQDEIAAFVGCSVDTLQRRKELREAYKRGMDHGRMSIRRVQFQEAIKGDKTMLIWLGKQYLGQRDTVPEKDDGALKKVTDAIKKNINTVDDHGNV